MEDRSALFNQLKNFSQRKLKKVETKVVTGTGEQLVEKRGAKGLQVLSGEGGLGGAAAGAQDEQPARKLDLQVGLVFPGLLIGSDDVAQDKSSLDSYGITHILNLDSQVANKFEDDYNYKNIAIQDKLDYQLEPIFDDCFDFIDDGRHYGNVLVHCSGTIGLSRSTTICIAYLMNKEKQTFTDAFNAVKEARSFVKPNEGFQKQLKEYEVKLRGAQQVKESGIDDPFALRKKQEIEQEKAMVAGAASVKNRMKMFGQQLDSGEPARSKSVSPSPYATSASSRPATGGGGEQQKAPPATKWSVDRQRQQENRTSATSKSMTPEPRKSWQTQTDTPSRPVAHSQQPPPPPPPMPTGPLSSNDKSNLPHPPPPPPPPPPATDANSRHSPAKSTSSSTSTSKTSTSHSSSRKPSITSTTEGNEKLVFGRKPPPPMKIRGGLSIERQDSTASDKNQSTLATSKTSQKSSLQLPLKKQFTSDSDGETATNGKDSRAPSPKAALRAAKQQASAASNQKRGSGASSPTAEHKPGLNRSSTKKLLNLIKTKTRTDLTLPDGDENDEIEALLGALETESIDNIDWDELGLDEDEVKEIIKQGGVSSSSSSSSSSSDDEEDEEEEEEEVERSTRHFVIRSK